MGEVGCSGRGSWGVGCLGRGDWGVGCSGGGLVTQGGAGGLTAWGDLGASVHSKPLLEAQPNSLPSASDIPR